MHAVQHIRRMSLLLTCMVCTLAAWAPDVSGQNREVVSLRLEQTPLRKALQQIQRQTGRSIIYSDALVKDIRVSYQCKGLPWKEGLTGVLANAPLAFVEVDGGFIVIIPKPEQRPPPQEIVIEGFVRDAETKEGLPFANVVVGGSQAGAATDGDGYFRLAFRDPEAQTLVVNYIGYTPKSVPIDSIEPGQPIAILIAMQRYEMGGLTVRAERPSPLTIAQQPNLLRMRPADPALLGGLGDGDVFRALQLLPGVGDDSGPTSYAYIRGGTPEQTLVMLDGMKLYHTHHFFGFQSTFNPQTIDQVEVYKGGYPARYGGRAIGVIDLSAKAVSLPGPQASVHLDMLRMGGTVRLPVGRRGGLSVAYRRSLGDVLESPIYRGMIDAVAGVYEGENADGESIDGPDAFQYDDVHATLLLKPTPKDRLSAHFYRSADKAVYGFSAWVPRFNAEKDETEWVPVPAEDTRDLVNQGGSAIWERTWTPRLQTRLSLACTQFAEEALFERATPDNLAFLEGESFLDTIDDYSYQADAEWQLSTKHRLEVGAWYTNETLGFRFNDAVNRERLTTNRTMRQVGGYVQDTWTLPAQVALTVGSRWTHYGPSDAWYTEPRLALRMPLRDRFFLHATWGRFHQFIKQAYQLGLLDVQDAFWIRADKNLKPTRAVHRTVGIGFDARDVSWSVDAYHKSFNYLHVWGPVYEVGVPIMDDAPTDLFEGEGTAWGFEALVQKQAGSLRGWLSYAWGRFDQTFPEVNSGETFASLQEQRHRLTAVATITQGAWRFTTSWRYASGKPYTAFDVVGMTETEDGAEPIIVTESTHGERLPPSHRLDVSVVRSFMVQRTSIDVAANIYNLYDQQNVWKRFFNTEGESLKRVDFLAPRLTPTLAVTVHFN